MNWTALRQFHAQCEALGITPPAALEQGLRLIRVAEEAMQDPKANLLAMSDAEVRTWIADVSVRRHDSGSSRGLNPGVLKFTDELAREVRDASLPDLERIIDELRPAFDALAEPLQVAARVYGFTSQTSPAYVIDLADEVASAAYRDARTAWNEIGKIAALRIAMSNIFEVSPTPAEVARSVSPRVAGTMPANFSVAFAAEDNWSILRGYYVDGDLRGYIDWFALARRGLRLNSPSETQQKIAGEAETVWGQDEATTPITHEESHETVRDELQLLPSYPGSAATG